MCVPSMGTTTLPETASPETSPDDFNDPFGLLPTALNPFLHAAIGDWRSACPATADTGIIHHHHILP